jgi:hypothetical protein
MTGLITVVTALDLLRRCADDAATEIALTADEVRRPGALLTLALSKQGLRGYEIWELPIVAEARAAAYVSSAPSLTVGALIALKAADRAQRSGKSWGAATDVAVAAVRRYVHLAGPDRGASGAGQRTQLGRVHHP